MKHLITVLAVLFAVSLVATVGQCFVTKQTVLNMIRK